MAANKHRLYGDRACIAALEDFLGRDIWAAARELTRSPAVLA